MNSETFTDPDICLTNITGCIKCTDDEINSCLICKEGLKLKELLQRIQK